MFPNENDSEQSSGENRQISQKDLVVLTVKSEAYDMLRELLEVKGKLSTTTQLLGKKSAELDTLQRQLGQVFQEFLSELPAERISALLEKTENQHDLIFNILQQLPASRDRFQAHAEENKETSNETTVQERPIKDKGNAICERRVPRRN